MMRIYTIFVIIVIAAYYLVGKVFTSKDPINDILVYSQKNPDPVWSPRVGYWVGSYYYQKSRYQETQKVLTDLLIEYPTCQYAAKALMTLGYATEENRDWVMAKSSMQQYILQFPKGDDFGLATSRLEMIKYRHGADVEPFPKKEDMEAR